MKNIIRKNICPVLLILNLATYAQKVQTGIYEVIYNTDTAFVHQNITKLTPLNRYDEIKYVYTYKYSDFIEKDFEIKYAVIIKTDNPDNKESYNLDFIWLNKTIPKTYGFSYSDNIIRKYIEFNASIIKNNNTQYWAQDVQSQTNHNFLQSYNSKNRYIEYVSHYTENNFHINRNYFFLTSNYYNLDTDSVKVDSSSYFNNPLVGSGYTKGTRFATINQPIVAFKLKAIKSYKRYLPVQADSVKFYVNGSKMIKMLYAGDFIALTNETNEWYYGEHITVDGKTTPGRIFIDDLITGKLKTLRANGLTLKVKYNLFDHSRGRNQSGDILRIKIYRQNKLIQVINNAGFVSSPNTVLNFEDVNFDGYKDLVVFAHDGGAGPNFGNNYYIFNVQTGQFVFHEQMSNLSQPEADHKTKTIFAAWRNGAGNYGSEKYKWINNKLTMVEHYEANYIDSNIMKETHKVLINGKMRSKTRTKKAN